MPSVQSTAVCISIASSMVLNSHTWLLSEQHTCTHDFASKYMYMCVACMLCVQLSRPIQWNQMQIKCQMPRNPMCIGETVSVRGLCADLGANSNLMMMSLLQSCQSLKLGAKMVTASQIPNRCNHCCWCWTPADRQIWKVVYLWKM